MFDIIPEGLEIDETKFNTCSYKSEVEVEYRLKNCCSAKYKTLKGFRCNLFSITGITATTCVNCTAYQNGKSN